MSNIENIALKSAVGQFCTNIIDWFEKTFENDPKGLQACSDPMCPEENELELTMLTSIMNHKKSDLVMVSAMAFMLWSECCKKTNKLSIMPKAHFVGFFDAMSEIVVKECNVVDSIEKTEGHVIQSIHDKLNVAIEQLSSGNIIASNILGFKPIEEALADIIIDIMAYSNANNLNVGCAVVEKVELLRSKND